MSIIKKCILAIVVSIILLSAMYGLNVEHKMRLYKVYNQAWFYIYNKFSTLILKAPHPIGLINKKKLKSKVHDQPSWAIKQINQDFSSYSHMMASKQNVVNTFTHAPDSNLIIMFTIKNKQVLINQKPIVMNGTCNNGLQVYTRIFQYIAENGYVDNVQFLLRLSDYFNNLGSVQDSLAPILTTSKDLNRTLDKRAILIPDYMSLEDIPKLTARIMLASQFYPWDKKSNVILWRGGHADVSGFRHKLVNYNKKHKNSMFDVEFVDNNKYYMSPEEQVKAKYLLNIDGHTAAWTGPIWQLLSNSVMIKQKSSLMQWYYNALSPNVHYISVNSDPQDLLKTVNLYSEDKLQKISQAGSDFAKNNLMLEDMVAYIIWVLQKYQELQRG